MIEVYIERIKNIITYDLDVNLKIEDIDSDVALSESGLGLDSIAIAELVYFLEKRFEFSFTENELQPNVFTNIKTIAEFVRNKTIT